MGSRAVGVKCGSLRLITPGAYLLLYRARIFASFDYRDQSEVPARRLSIVHTSIDIEKLASGIRRVRMQPCERNCQSKLADHLSGMCKYNYTVQFSRRENNIHIVEPFWNVCTQYKKEPLCNCYCGLI